MLSKYQIVEELGKQKIVEKIARHFKTYAREDLCQYVYLYLLTITDEDKLNELYNTNKLKQYISGILYRQIVSVHSDYFRTYSKQNLSIDEEVFDGHSYSDNLYFEDEQPHQVEDEVDKYLSTLSPLEQSICWLQIYSFVDRSDDIKYLKDKYNLTKTQFAKLTANTRNKVREYFGKQPPPRKPYTKSTRVIMEDLEGNIIRIYNCRLECCKDLMTRGFTSAGIYKCLVGKRNTYKGYKFYYE